MKIDATGCTRTLPYTTAGRVYVWQGVDILHPEAPHTVAFAASIN